MNIQIEALPDDFVDDLLKPESKGDKPEPVDRTGLTYCDFCKGYYNEYHFGEPEQEKD
jgi:hypothetical protein